MANSKRFWEQDKKRGQKERENFERLHMHYSTSLHFSLYPRRRRNAMTKL